MERRRQARTPVNIDALLIGEKTVPKGCRVINVSQQGMLLYCEPDGRLLTFRDGDNVDIMLTVRHQGEQKKLTIPSTVKHAAENSVDVEFHHPDPILMDLIESYRVSNKHKLEATLAPHQTVVTPLPSQSDSRSNPSPAGQTAGSKAKQFIMAMLTLIIIACIAAGGYIYTASIDKRLASLEGISTAQSRELESMRNQVFNAGLQEARYASLDARLTSLSKSFARIETRLTPIVTDHLSNTANQLESANQQLALTEQTVSVTPAAVTGSGADRPVLREKSTDSVLPAADAQPDPVTRQGVDKTATGSGQGLERQAGRDGAASSKGSLAWTAPAKTGSATPADQEKSTATLSGTVGTGPWTINLLSSPSRPYVEKMAAKAAGMAIPASISSADIKGRQYWRLQITGFESAAAAREYAEPVKRNMDIGDVWIMKSGR